MAEEWKLQVNYKLATGDLINIRANSADELSVLLESLGITLLRFTQHSVGSVLGVT
jgi:hypothetical protein